MRIENIDIKGNFGENAQLVTYILDNSPEIDENRERPAILICPGGGYEMTSDREAEAIAIQMLSLGYHAFVLRYSVSPATFPTALLELAQSVALIRNNSENWHVNKEKIIVAGFSAGGHLAASLGVFWHEKWLEEKLQGVAEGWRPNGLMLAYPVISSGEFAHEGSFVNLMEQHNDLLKEQLSLEKQVTSYTPPSFLWHTVEDDCVPVENSLLFVTALRKNKVPFEFHVFPKGGHGLGLATKETESIYGNGIQKACAQWIKLFNLWVEENI